MCISINNDSATTPVTGMRCACMCVQYKHIHVFTQSVRQNEKTNADR